ncbi:hypothetical protein [Bosea vaviloviae]|uniref:Uncharacterized protein n=1 Tax=Bosea vaviloviae TaxID=1526658 RepID=A0A0N1F718_9HYPH|nr:hypothetical protein [Bosea vaviloviae]KPH82180.1 hypothetical protein AE618_04500 [Bosea vaviloviae]
MTDRTGDTKDHPGASPDSSRAAQRIKRDAAGQYGEATTSPNKDGLTSANPVVLSEDGDATSGNGHGRDRDGSKTAQD